MEKYATLTELVNKTLNDSVGQQFFDVGEFFKNMEFEFARWGFRDEDYDGVDNILLVRLDAVGDFVLTSAAIREIRMNFPYSHITLVVSTRAHILAELCPYVNEVLPFNMEFDINNITELIYRVGVFARQSLWKRQFRLAFSFRYFNEWYILQLFMIYLSGAKIRVGYDQNAGLVYTGQPIMHTIDISKRILTHPIQANEKLTQDCERSLYLLKSFGLHIYHTNLEVWYSASNVFDAKYYLSNFAPGRIKVLAGIGASHPIKSYPMEKYLTAFKKIISKGAAIILSGGPDDADKANFLKEHLPAEYVRSLIDVKANWRTTAAIISQMDMYIGNDTGTVHIAAALKLPVVVLSRVAKNHKRPNEIETYYPYQTTAIVLQPKAQIDECKDKVDHFGGCDATDTHCIAQISPKEIVAAYDKIVDLMKITGTSKFLP